MESAAKHRQKCKNCFLTKKSKTKSRLTKLFPHKRFVKPASFICCSCLINFPFRTGSKMIFSDIQSSTLPWYSSTTERAPQFVVTRFRSRLVSRCHNIVARWLTPFKVEKRFLLWFYPKHPLSRVEIIQRAHISFGFKTSQAMCSANSKTTRSFPGSSSWRLQAPRTNGSCIALRFWWFPSSLLAAFVMIAASCGLGLHYLSTNSCANRKRSTSHWTLVNLCCLWFGTPYTDTKLVSLIQKSSKQRAAI